MSSVRARITLGASAIVAVVLVLGAVLFSWTLERTLVDGIADAAERTAAALARDLDEDDGLIAGAGEDDLAQLLSPGGDVLAANGAATGLPAIIDPDADQRIVAVDDDRYVVVTAPEDDRVLALGVSLDEVDDSVAAARTLLWTGVPVLLVVVAAVTWFTVGRSLRPVERMRDEVASIGAGDLDHRLEIPSGRDEIPRLARTLNGMLERLESGSRQQRQFISDASHELRSPIAAMRQSAEVLQRYPDADLDLPATVIAETERLGTLVSSLLVLARSDEHGLALRREPVDLDDLALAEVSRLRSERTVRADGSAIAPVRVAGDLRLLDQLLRNLVDNAARHARSAVAVGIREAPDGAAVITVEDDGHGIAPVDRARVFERFVRLDEGRARDDGGSGLGLAIVAAVAAAHDGEVRVDDSPLGGARFTVTLPA